MSLYDWSVSFQSRYWPHCPEYSGDAKYMRKFGVVLIKLEMGLEIITSK